MDKDNFFILNYRKYNLQETKIYDDIKIKFPIDFLEIDNNWYNKIFKADFIFSNKNKDIIFLFKIYNVDILLLNQDIINEIKAIYGKININEELIKSKEKEMSVLTFQNDIMIYKLYFLELDDKTLIFNIIYEKYYDKQLKDILNQIALTIENN